MKVYLEAFDPEERNLRLHRLRKYAKMLRGAAHNAVVFDHNYKRAGAHDGKAARADAIAKAYSGRNPVFASNYKNSERSGYRLLGKRDGGSMKAGNLAAKVAKHIGVRKGSKIDRDTRAKRVMKIINVGTQSSLAYRAQMRGDFDQAKRLGSKSLPLRAKWDKHHHPEKTAYDHAQDAQRAHLLAAKFLKTPGKRKALNKALRIVRNGQALVNRVRNYKKLDNPLSHLGVRTDR